MNWVVLLPRAKWSLVLIMLLVDMLAANALAQNLEKRRSDLKTSIVHESTEIERLRDELAEATGNGLKAKLSIELASSLKHRAVLRLYLREETKTYTFGQVPFPEKAMEDFSAALKTLQNLLNKNPKCQRCPEALFAIAMIYRQTEQFDKMIKVLQRLKADFPNSSQTDMALLTLGIFYRDRFDSDKEVISFDSIVKRNNPPFALLAHYYLGWSYINLANFKEALKHFEVLAMEKGPIPGFDFSKAKFVSMEGDSFDYRIQALDALVYCYSNAMPVDKAFEYFRKFQLTKKLAKRVYEKLADRYYILEKFSAAATLFRHLLGLLKDCKQDDVAGCKEDETRWKKRLDEIEKEIGRND